MQKEYLTRSIKIGHFTHYEFLMIIIVFFMIVINCSYVVYTIPYKIYIFGLLVTIMTIALLVKSMTAKHTYKGVIVSISLALLGIFSGIRGDSEFMLICLFSLYISYLDWKVIVRIYLIASIASVFFISMLSLLGFLPIGTPGSFQFGFVNPNVIGFIITMIIIEITVLSWERLSLYKLFFYLVVVLIIYNLFNDSTSLAGLMTLWTVCFCFIFFKSNKIFINFLRVVTLSLPILGTFLSLWLAEKYGTTNFFIKINDALSMRPQIWNFFLNTFPPKLFNQSIQIITDGTQTFVGGGAFDGGYIEGLIYHGWIPFLLIIFTLEYLIIKLFHHSRYELICCTIALLVIAFTEGTPFNSFQSFIIPMAFSSLYTDR